MKLGLFTPVLGHLSFDDMLEAVGRLKHVEALELGTGCWPGASHVDVGRAQGCRPRARVPSADR